MSLSLAMKNLWIPLGKEYCLFNLLVVIHLISFEWKEIWDKEPVNKYLGILETAAVLEQIYDKFAGMNG